MVADKFRGRFDARFDIDDDDLRRARGDDSPIIISACSNNSAWSNPLMRRKLALMTIQQVSAQRKYVEPNKPRRKRTLPVPRISTAIGRTMENVSRCFGHVSRFSSTDLFGLLVRAVSVVIAAVLVLLVGTVDDTAVVADDDDDDDDEWREGTPIDAIFVFLPSP